MTATDLLIGTLVLFAAFTQGAIGFGFGLIVMAVLPRLLPLPEAVATVAVMGVLVSGLLFLRYRRSFDLRAVAPLFVGAALGLPLGVLTLRHLDPDPATRLLGALIIAYAIWGLWPIRRRSAPRSAPLAAKAWGYPAGFLAGVLGGAFATGGPPVIIYATARRWSPAAFKALLQGFFVCATLVHLGLLASASILTLATAARALWFAPLVPIGVLLGAHVGDRLPPRVFGTLVLAALLVLGVEYLVLGR